MMFLAWNEIKKNKLRFILIIGILMLMSYLVFFLSGLANGLASLNREAIDKWDASAIILTEESDMSLGQSSMNVNDLNSVNAEEMAVIGNVNAIASNGTNKANVAIFGIKKDEPKLFIKPSFL